MASSWHRSRITRPVGNPGSRSIPTRRTSIRPSWVALAKTLGRHDAALIRAHGAVLVAESVPAVFIDIVHFTENAETLYRAAALGPVTPLTRTEMSSFLERFDRPRHIAKLWRYYVGRSLRDGAMPEDWVG